MAQNPAGVALLNDPVAQNLLRSRIPARLAYVSRDGTPRVVPIWFHWDGKNIVLGTPPKAPKVRALQQNPNVALTIDSDTAPYKVLQIRGTAKVETVQGVVPEYAAAAERYFGSEQGKGWVENARKLFPQMMRIAIEPKWVCVLDFETRFPSAIADAMSGKG